MDWQARDCAIFSGSHTPGEAPEATRRRVTSCVLFTQGSQRENLRQLAQVYRRLIQRGLKALRVNHNFEYCAEAMDTGSEIEWRPGCPGQLDEGRKNSKAKRLQTPETRLVPKTTIMYCAGPYGAH